MTSLGTALHRTLLLIRDEVGTEVADDILIKALTNTRVALVADATTLASHSAQTAFVTAAGLMGRSGHEVFLAAPDVELLAPQPPLGAGGMIEQLTLFGSDLLPGVNFAIGAPTDTLDLAIILGDTPANIYARRHIRLNATAWSGMLESPHNPSPWRATSWPFGALAAGGLGAGEAFKVAMAKLLPHALSLENTALRFAPTNQVQFDLASTDTPFCGDLGEIDCISGGAITNAALYCLARIPGVTARGRIIEPGRYEPSNLNRCMLLRRSCSENPKAWDIAQTLGMAFRFKPVDRYFDREFLSEFGFLASVVMVGVDHIPSRWEVQEANPEWVIVGATSHWSAMSSFHAKGHACARCLHNEDDHDTGLIPTTACTSFWAGLLTASYLARRAAGDALESSEQQIFLSPFQPRTPFVSSVRSREGCPTCAVITSRPNDVRSGLSTMSLNCP